MTTTRRVEDTRGHNGQARTVIVDDFLTLAHEIDDTLDIKGEIRYGPASNVLVKVSQGAALEVLGSRGRGQAASLLSGSVSEHCLRDAVCPVTIVR